MDTVILTELARLLLFSYDLESEGYKFTAQNLRESVRVIRNRLEELEKEEKVES